MSSVCGAVSVMRGSRRKKKGVNVVNLDDGKRQISPNIRTIADDYPVNCRSTDCVSLHLDSVVGSLPGTTPCYTHARFKC